jgi:hypothetical protein
MRRTCPTDGSRWLPRGRGLPARRCSPRSGSTPGQVKRVTERFGDARGDVPGSSSAEHARLTVPPHRRWHPYPLLFPPAMSALPLGSAVVSRFPTRATTPHPGSDPCQDPVPDEQYIFAVCAKVAMSTPSSRKTDTAPLVDLVLSQQDHSRRQKSHRPFLKCGRRLWCIADEPLGQLFKLFQKQPRPRLPHVAHYFR